MCAQISSSRCSSRFKGLNYHGAYVHAMNCGILCTLCGRVYHLSVLTSSAMCIMGRCTPVATLFPLKYFGMAVFLQLHHCDAMPCFGGTLARNRLTPPDMYGWHWGIPCCNCLSYTRRTWCTLWVVFREGIWDILCRIWSGTYRRLSLYQSINQTSIAPISLAKPGSVAQQPNQCSAAK